jgi:hypothetical protein
MAGGPTSTALALVANLLNEIRCAGGAAHSAADCTAVSIEIDAQPMPELGPENDCAA